MHCLPNYLSNSYYISASFQCSRAFWAIVPHTTTVLLKTHGHICHRKISVYWLAPHGLFSLLPYNTEDYLPRNSTSQTELDPSIINHQLRKCTTQPQVSLGVAFSQLSFPLYNDSNLYRVDIKLASTYMFLFLSTSSFCSSLLPLFLLHVTENLFPTFMCFWIIWDTLNLPRIVCVTVHLELTTGAHWVY